MTETPVPVVLPSLENLALGKPSTADVEEVGVQRTRKESNMAGPIYKLFMVRFNRSMYELSEEERRALMSRVGQALKQVGGKTVVMCASGWANEQWQYFGVEELPDIEAVQKQSELVSQTGWFGYIDESFTLLGTKLSPQ
jgi:Family of unknown function (DUF6616)